MATKPLPVHGADISHHQKTVDLKKAKAAGLDWLTHKATQGVHFTDPRYAERRDLARKLGLPFSAYHFAQTNTTPERQAAHFLEVAGIKPGDKRPMLDLEDDKRVGSFFSKMSVAARTEWVRRFVDVVKKELGVAPFIYTPFDLANHFDCPLWVARYSNKNEPPKVPKPWSTYTIRQFSNGDYGVPNSFPGLGHVDLNCWNGDPAKMLKTFTIPKPKPKPKPAPKKPALLKMAHLSMETGDSRKQWEADLNVLFSRGYDVVFGTESKHNKKDWRKAVIADIAAKHGYLTSVPDLHDTWVAVKKTLVASEWSVGSNFVLHSDSHYPGVPGPWGEKGVTWASWNMGKTYGKFAVAAVHYLTWGGTKTVALKNKTDDQYATSIARWRSKLPSSVEAFVGGDFNRNDKTYDVFRGKAPFITASDELKKWPNTGHGPIDGIAREKISDRVRCVRLRALDDKELKLNTDHFLVEVDYEVRAL